MMDITYHYPPELFNLLIDTIPRLSRSYQEANRIYCFSSEVPVFAGLILPTLKTKLQVIATKSTSSRSHALFSRGSMNVAKRR
jgi:hypothetical protein